jgi:phage terminase large subunit-like protein
MAGLSLLTHAVRAAGGREAFIELHGPRLVAAMSRDWRAIARPEQVEPTGDWLVWLILAGRGFGKSRTGAETVVGWAKAGRCKRMALVAPTSADARDVMVEGESGVLVCSDRADFHALYEPSKRRITWPNGAIATLYSAEEPDRLRGPQHDGAWVDELAAWASPQSTWDQLQFGLRLGAHPRCVVTTTPRPIPLVRFLAKESTVAVTRGSTYDNEDNLADSFLGAIKRAYEGTRLGRQELNAEILDDNPGALWRISDIESARVKFAPELRRVVGAIDPAVTSREDSDETGILFGGTGTCSCRGTPELHGFVLDDQSGIYTPDQWAKAASRAYKHHKADRIVAEVNNGGDLVGSNLRTLGDQTIAYSTVHASRGKAIRAEPIAALYEQGKIHHVGFFPKLEDQLTQWNPLTDERSPDRLDALVWLMTELMLGQIAPEYGGRQTSSPRRI